MAPLFLNCINHNYHHNAISYCLLTPNHHFLRPLPSNQFQINLQFSVPGSRDGAPDGGGETDWRQTGDGTDGGWGGKNSQL